MIHIGRDSIEKSIGGGGGDDVGGNVSGVGFVDGGGGGNGDVGGGGGSGDVDDGRPSQTKCLIRSCPASAKCEPNTIMRQTSSADKYFCESRAESGVQIIPATKSVSEPDQEIVMLYYETPGQ